MVRGNLLFFILLILVSCNPIHTKYRYSIDSTVEHIDLYFDKSIVTERRTILLPCKERYYVEKQAVYTTIGKGKIRIGPITNSATTDINGQIVNLDSIYTNNFCLDSIISAYVDYDDKLKSSRPPYSGTQLDKILDRQFIIKNLFHNSFLNENDTLLYDENSPNYIFNFNAGLIGYVDSKIDTAECIRIIHSFEN